MFLRWSFIASCTLCQSWQKKGEIMEKMWFLFKILHVRGRNTCLCKGECLPPSSCTPVLWPCLHTLCLSLIYIYMVMNVFFTYLYMCCLFSFFLYTHVSYYLYAIYYFCFTQRCLDEFCLKCFRNTGCQSLLAINSLLAKFFKSLC